MVHKTNSFFPNGAPYTNVAFSYVAKKPNSQKNDVRCEYTRGAPEPYLLQIPIDLIISQLIVIIFVLVVRKMPQNFRNFLFVVPQNKKLLSLAYIFLF